MTEITNANVKLMYDLTGVNQVVVQKGNVGAKYLYALQLLHNQNDTVVYRAKPGHSFKKLSGKNPTASDVQKINCLYLAGTTDSNPDHAAGGHTQTWEYAGSSNNDDGGWFIGTKPKKTSSGKFDTQIARIPFPSKNGSYYTKNTQLPRISNLNAAGRNYHIDYSGSNLVRSEAAVTPSPNYQYLLIATIDSTNTSDNKGNGYFSLYNLSDMNQAINNAGTGDVNLAKEDIGNKAVKAFKIENFVGKIGSIQGYDIDENLNIYISSEYHPDKTNIVSKPRKIVKIPWGTTSSEQWNMLDLTNDTRLNMSGYATEFEGIQVNKENDLYLTIAYHNSKNYTTEYNRIYKVTW